MTAAHKAASDAARLATVNALAQAELCAQLINRAASEHRAATHERDAVREAARRTIERMKRYQARVEAQASDEARIHLEQRMPLLHRCEAALEAGGTDDAVQALAGLILALGGAPTHASMTAFDALMADDAALDLRHTPPAPPSPPATSALEALGHAMPCPVDEWTEARLRLDTAHAIEMLEPALAGRHLAAPRKVAGLSAYEHHGLTLGDGRIVHFTGEPTAIADACVAVTTAAEFRAKTAAAEIVEYQPLTFDERPLAILRPALATLRALSLLDSGGYSLLQWNCEHFACWAKLGVRHSQQVARVRDGLAGLAGLSPVALEALALANEELQSSSPLVFERVPAPSDWDEGPAGDVLAFDLGRAYWADDLEVPTVFVPVWDTAGEPAAGFERPWTADPVGSDAAWSRNCPSTRLRHGWHAALLWIEDRGFWWLTSDGHWLSASGDPLAGVEQRLQASTDVLVAYLAGSYSASKFLEIIDRLGLQDLVAEVFARRPEDDA